MEILVNKKPRSAYLQDGAYILFNADSDLGISQSNLSTIIVSKLSKMFGKFLHLVLFATIGIFVSKAKRSVPSVLTLLLAGFCTRHCMTS